MGMITRHFAKWATVLTAVIWCALFAAPSFGQTDDFNKIYEDAPDGFYTWRNPVAQAGIGNKDGEPGNIYFGTTNGDPHTAADDHIAYVSQGHAMLYVNGLGIDGETEVGTEGILEKPPTVDLRSQSAGYTWRTDAEDANITVVYKQWLVNDVLRWEYQLTNYTPYTLRVGFRAWFDTDWNFREDPGTDTTEGLSKQGAAGPYYVPGKPATDIIQEWVDSDVPTEWFIREPVLNDTSAEPALRFRIPLQGTNITRPCRLVYSTTEEVTGYGWTEILDALLPENKNQEPFLNLGASSIDIDSGALGLYYPILGLRYKETRVIRGEMRLDWSRETISEPYALALDVPDYVTYRSGDNPATTTVEDGYFDPSEFTLTAYLVNASKMLEPTATATVDLGKGLVLSPSVQTQTSKKVYSILGNSYSWTIKPDGSASGLIPIKVTATLVPGGSLTSTIYVNVPAMTVVPSVRLQRASQFLGFPFTFTNSNSMTALSAVSTAVGSDFAVAWYDTLAKTYEFAHPSDTQELIALEAGRAYWLNVPTTAPVIKSSVPLSGATPLDQTRTVWVKLDRGWNAISNPYQFSIVWAYCNVVFNNTEYSIADAIKSGLIRREMWAWDASNQQYYYKRPTGSYDPPTNPYPVDETMGEMKTLEGYWLYATESCYLVFAPNPFLTTMGGDAGYEKFWDTDTTTTGSSRSAGTTDNWRINLVAETSQSKDRTAVLGVGSDEADGISDGDLMAPPLSPSGLSVYFPRTGWGRAAGNYAVDLQAPGATKTWAMDVNCTQANEQVVLRWPDLTRLPARLPVVLVDELTGKQVAMRTAPCYTYNSGQGGVRRFRIVAGAAIQRLQITSTQVLKSKASTGATVQCTLSVPAEVTLRIRTTGGRLVRTLGPQEVSGLGTVTWDGRDDHGRLLAAGVYLGELYAEGQDGQRIRAIVTLVTRN